MTALGLVLVIEGALYALFPEAMLRMVARMREFPAQRLRVVGLGAAIAGLVVVRLARG